VGGVASGGIGTARGNGDWEEAAEVGPVAGKFVDLNFLRVN